MYRFIAYIYSIFSISLHFQIIIFSKVSKYILLLTMKLKGKQLNPIIILWVHVSTLNLTTFIDNLDKLLWKYFLKLKRHNGMLYVTRFIGGEHFKVLLLSNAIGLIQQFHATRHNNNGFLSTKCLILIAMKECSSINGIALSCVSVAYTTI